VKDRLELFKSDTYSQNGEDGVIAEIVKRIGLVLTPAQNRANSAGRVLGLVATLHQNLECEQYGTTGT